MLSTLCRWAVAVVSLVAFIAPSSANACGGCGASAYRSCAPVVACYPKIRYRTCYETVTETIQPHRLQGLLQH